MKKISSKKFVIPAVACLAVLLFLCYYFFFTPMLKGGEACFVYIDQDDNIDSVFSKLDGVASHHAMTGFTGTR